MPKHKDYCLQCPRDANDIPPIRSRQALYIRLPKDGFKRVGWRYSPCGHVEMEREAAIKGET